LIRTGGKLSTAGHRAARGLTPSTSTGLLTRQGSIRFLCIHRYAPGVRKGGTSPHELQWLGKRGKRVKTMRLIPAQRAHAIARRLQGTPGVTVSLL
jgi:hypothetical protein